MIKKIHTKFIPWAHNNYNTVYLCSFYFICNVANKPILRFLLVFVLFVIYKLAINPEIIYCGDDSPTEHAEELATLEYHKFQLNDTEKAYKHCGYHKIDEKLLTKDQLDHKAELEEAIEDWKRNIAETQAELAAKLEKKREFEWASESDQNNKKK